MKRTRLHIVLFILLLSGAGFSQDIPLFNQKLTNSSLYNPSLAGRGLGSITFANRTHWNGVPGAPKSNFVSGHIPFMNQKFGAGFNMISDKIGVLENLYTNAAFSYHLDISDDSRLSFGASTEYTLLRRNISLVDARDESDPLINAESKSSFDFSAGVSFTNEYLDIGLSTNRLATALGLSDFPTQISQFYTGHIALKVPLDRYNKFEPIFVYTKLSPESAQWDAGLYYSYRDAIIVGANYRSGGLISPSVALHFNKTLLLGYSFEMFGSGIQRNIGGTHEVAIRYDFMQDSYFRGGSNRLDVMARSIAYKRKSLSYSRVQGKPKSASNPKYKSKLKRNLIRSPNYRFNNSKKLNNRQYRSVIGKRNSTSYKANKRRETNYKKYSRMMKRIR